MQNIVILAGNIGQAPEARTTQGGTKITHFTLATSRPRLSEGRPIRDEHGYRVMDTEWHRITFFDRMAEIAGEYLKKGKSVYIEGRLKTRKYTDKDGVEIPCTTENKKLLTENVMTASGLEGEDESIWVFVSRKFNALEKVERKN